MCLFVCLCVFVCKEEQAKSAKAAGVYLLISSAGVTFEWEARRTRGREKVS